MWDRDYRDYKRDQPLVKQPLEPSKGLYGCEMHEINGWGNTLHKPVKVKHGFFGSLFLRFFGHKEENNP